MYFSFVSLSCLKAFNLDPSSMESSTKLYIQLTTTQPQDFGPFDHSNYINPFVRENVKSVPVNDFINHLPQIST